MRFSLDEYLRSIGESRFEWMHPSWRDLVIDHLVTNAAARRSFLSRCGVNGVMLALSGGGGKEGTRNLPLLVEPEDWSALEKAALSILSTLSPFDIARLLSAVQDALTRVSVVKRDDSDRLRIEQLAHFTLNTVRQKWDQSATAIPFVPLQHYYEISLSLAPLHPSPQLQATWDESWEEAQGELSFVDIDSLETRSLQSWLLLVDLLSENEPRFLRTVMFPQQFFESFSKFVNGLIDGVDDFLPSDEADSIKEEIEKLKSITRLLQRLGRWFPKIGATIETAIARLKIKRDAFEEDYSERYLEEEGPEIYDDDERGSSGPPSGGFGVSEIFADL